MPCGGLRAARLLGSPRGQRSPRVAEFGAAVAADTKQPDPADGAAAPGVTNGLCQAAVAAVAYANITVERRLRRIYLKSFVVCEEYNVWRDKLTPADMKYGCDTGQPKLAKDARLALAEPDLDGLIRKLDAAAADYLSVVERVWGDHWGRAHLIFAWENACAWSGIFGAERRWREVRRILARRVLAHTKLAGVVGGIVLEFCGRSPEVCRGRSNPCPLALPHVYH